MAARQRASVDPAPCTGSQLTYTRFMARFPDHDACLEYLRERFHPDGSDCPKCGRATKFHRIKSRAAYSCQWCGHQVYPTAGTIFHKSTTNLQMWFWAIFLMSSTRCGISAKQLEREIGVSYPTAHRMFKQIRTLLSEPGAAFLDGEVEVDETWHGGRPRQTDRNKGHWHVQAKKSLRPTVLGMVERGGRVRAQVIKSRARIDVRSTMQEHILPSAMLYTDQWTLYTGAGKEYKGHRRINHSARVYVEGDTHTNTVEGFFGLWKNGVRGVYPSISTAYLQNYLDEFCWRYNHRHDDRPMFWSILDRVRKEGLASA
jgi:hypothetical protein